VAARVTAIHVAVTHGYASIDYDGGRTVFVGAMPVKTEIGLLSTERGLRIDITVQPDTIRALAAAVKDMTASNREEK
jgi:hypothetical protein